MHQDFGQVENRPPLPQHLSSIRGPLRRSGPLAPGRLILGQ